MYQYRRPLVFPKFKFLKEGKIETKHSSKNVSLYTLDWAGFDKILKDRHEEWKNKYHPDSKEIPFFEGLPDPYNALVKKNIYALNKDYIAEIKRCAYQCNYEWCMERNFDTMIRETCLEPAISFVKTAFYLMSDCLYDEDTSYYDRSGRVILKHAMLARFWRHQTGGGLVGEHSDFDKLLKLKDLVSNFAETQNNQVAIRDQTLHREISNFFVTYEQYEQELEDAFNNHKIIYTYDSSIGVPEKELNNLDESFTYVNINNPAEQQRADDGYREGGQGVGPPKSSEE